MSACCNEYCTVLYCTVLYCAVLYCVVLYCTVLYCTVLCCTVLCCTVLYCTVLYCTVLYCTVLYCTVYLIEHCLFILTMMCTPYLARINGQGLLPSAGAIQSYHHLQPLVTLMIRLVVILMQFIFEYVIAFVYGYETRRHVHYTRIHLVARNY